MIRKQAYLYLQFSSMTSLLARQFAEGRIKTMLTNYILLMNKKPDRVINSVIPGLCQNLFKSTEAFIEGVASLDSEFIESTCSIALQQKLLYQFQQMKKNQSIIKQKVIQNISSSDNKSSTDDKSEQPGQPFFTISPYVIFGQTIQQRNKSRNPWDNCRPLLSTNRFIQTDAKDLSFKTLFANQIFGFNCFYHNKKVEYEIVEKGEIIHAPAKTLVVSFETDSENHEFFVSDFNFIVKESLE